MASKIPWLFLVLLLTLSTFGLRICALFLLSTLFTLAGCAVVIRTRKKTELPINLNNDTLFKRDEFPFPGLTKVIDQMQDLPERPKHDQRLTGSNEIDEPLREIIRLIFRDFIHSWYNDLTTNEDFVEDVHEMIKTVINNFSKSIKEVDWVTFLTRQIVEDFMSHLRLYRHAETKFKRNQKETPEHSSIESLFFDLERNMEKTMCREQACTSEEHEKEYLQKLSDVILYLLLPSTDFNNRGLKNFLREVLVGSIFQPLVQQFSDPDYINQQIVWMCKEHSITSKALLSVIRRTESNEELSAFIQIAKHELKVQKSKDTGDKDEMRRYMKSINFMQDIAHQRHQRLLGHSKHAETDSTEFYLGYDIIDSIDSVSEKSLVSLPFDVILNNNIALHYFSEYLTGIAAEGYVFFYHNVEGFRTAAEMIKSTDITDGNNEAPTKEKLRVLAQQIFDTYFGENAATKVDLEEPLLKKLLSRIKTDDISVSCFDEVQDKVHGILENDFYLSGFKHSKQYVKLLAELDLLRDPSLGDGDSLSSKSEEHEKFEGDAIIPTDEEMLNELMDSQVSPTSLDFPDISSGGDRKEVKEIGTLFAEVHSTGITHHAGKTFAVYAISVNHCQLDGVTEKWFVVRRYSEFYDFHEAILDKYPHLSSFNFPPKKPFSSLSRQLMEKRRYMLNEFLQFLLLPENLATCSEVKKMLYDFLQPDAGEKGKKSFVRTVGTFVNPIKTSVKTVGSIVKLVPDAFFGLKDGLVKAFTKSSRSESAHCVQAAKVFDEKDSKADDIPFRIILMLMDEVFNLRNKDLWFRRRIMALLRQIIKTMQGGAINRKIKDYVQGVTSASSVAEWLKLLNKTLWPNGVLVETLPERDFNTKMRTRTVAKILLLCAIPDELKHIIGYETSFKGAMLVVNMFQHPSLNRRLSLVLLESLLVTLFPHNRLNELFQKLHSGTPTTMENTFKEDTEDKTPPKDVPKKSNNKKSPQCLKRQDTLSKKSKKSPDSSIFYTGLPDPDEDRVFLPLGR